jgi:hypothetical protein
MHTKALNDAQTRSVAIGAPPAAVLEYLADPQNLPRWAPGFAPSIVERDGQLIVRQADDNELVICLEVGAEAGTVDIVSAADRRRGAFTRVIPNADGSELLFTLLFDPSNPSNAVAAQMEIVDAELVRVRNACEASTANIKTAP